MKQNKNKQIKRNQWQNNEKIHKKLGKEKTYSEPEPSGHARRKGKKGKGDISEKHNKYFCGRQPMLKPANQHPEQPGIQGSPQRGPAAGMGFE